MNYFEVALSDRGLKNHQTLTYSSEENLSIGDAVKVPIRNRVRNGIVISKSKKPEYPTRPIEKLIESQAVNSHLIDLANWISRYYSVDLGTTIGLMLPRGAEKKRRQTEVNVLQKTVTRNYATTQLNQDQKLAFKKIIKHQSTHLLHGITGSGKSRLYIELAKHYKDNQLGSIILVPEIGLTTQMIDEFMTYLKDDIFVIHSHQTESERHKLWLQIKKSKSPIVIGPRSALFAPIKNLGLIVIDEAHETSYKQDVSPKYHAIRVAAKLRELTKSTLVLGSATPRIEDYYQAQAIGASIIKMPNPVKPFNQRTIEVIDLKNRDDFKKDKWLSDSLIGAIDKTIKESRQVLIFHNRRGTSTSVICQSCGWIANCPNCDIPLTHHDDWHKLVCHICNHQTAALASCPTCRKPELVYKGAGTKEIVSRVKKLFPHSNIERFDSDIIGRENMLESRHAALVNNEIDIIIGTQMIAKGLDLPNLGLVGVIVADTSLHLPDFSSNERTYQLINQVIGRVGRHQDGTAIIQTYSPSSPSIKYAIDNNWESFLAKEILDRKAGKYPPHGFLLKLSLEGKTSDQTRSDVSKFGNLIRQKISNVEVLGPSPAFHHKTKTGWRWQLVVKSQDRSKLAHIARSLPAKWQFDIDPINLL